MSISEDEILQYRWLGREEGFTALEHEIVFRDLCCGCGACAAVCPEKVIEVDEFPKLIGECTDCGYCLMQCPRSFFDSGDVEGKIFGQKTEDALGRVEKMAGVKALDKKLTKRSQDGGFVTALLKYALEKKIIDGAIVANANEEWTTKARLITDAKELAETAGTKYTNCPNLAALMEAKDKGLKKLAIVGLPCHIEGARKLQHHPIEEVDLKDRIAFTVSLFCKSNFLYEGLVKELLEKRYGLDPRKMTKIDIKGKYVIAETNGAKLEVPLEEAHEHERKGCEVCWDFTSRISDFSAGSVGTPAGYTTVLARTKKAVELLEGMRKDKIIETTEVDREAVQKLQEVKEKRARRESRKRIRQVVPPPYKHLKL